MIPKTVGFSVADAWAGRLTWSRSFRKYGGKPVLIIEQKPQARTLAGHCGFTDAAIVKGYYGCEWKLPPYRNKVRVIGAGPLCQAFSAAGKQNPHDQRAFCFVDTASVLEWCGADIAILEITTEFAGKDEDHNHCTRAVRVMAIRGMIVRAIDQLSLPRLGGPVARKRSFFTFHSNRLYLALPTPKPIPQNQAPGCIYDFLLPVQQVPRWTLLAGTFTATASNVGDTDPYKPRTGGYLYFNEERAVIQGALVRIEAPLARSRDVDPLSWWRLLRKSVNGFELLLADRKRPLKVNLLSQDQIVEVRSEKIPVASPGHPLISFRAWGEPPLGPCSAVRDDRLDEWFPENAPVVRTLTPKELFQAMDPERGAEEHDLLLAAGTSRGELYSLVGESIAKRMTDAVAERTQQELSSFDHLVATGRADPDPPAQPAQHWVTVAAEEFATIKEAWERTSPTPSPSPPLVECASRAGGYGTPPPGRSLAVGPRQPKTEGNKIGSAVERGQSSHYVPRICAPQPAIGSG